MAFNPSMFWKFGWKIWVFNSAVGWGGKNLHISMRYFYPISVDVPSVKYGINTQTYKNFTQVLPHLLLVSMISCEEYKSSGIEQQPPPPLLRPQTMQANCRKNGGYKTKGKFKKRLLLRCIHHFISDLINNIDHKPITGTWTLISDL